ncbi:MAG: hypothetical protein EAZ39_26110 [Oscillatoriales cyanobacterium]|nr:MAG: hypothetical protein EAZ45_25680 [Oscillatoriales cyanobacterium]TAG14072.1 MAG: hypothetical protein EAZ39_26110 [Oscillatoriales cyanobacterium]TAG38678.1 MAG: hypothetical protein EAZ33_19805 [Oscillatoriales cyanobacterium]TAG51742.1 MAG: hypothetical protein EAZ28_30745 [Oscillatoriales cyanobacterium]
MISPRQQSGACIRLSADSILTIAINPIIQSSIIESSIFKSSMLQSKIQNPKSYSGSQKK